MHKKKIDQLWTKFQNRTGKKAWEQGKLKRLEVKPTKP